MLLNQVVREISRFADLAGNVITDGQRRAVRQVTQDTQQLLLMAMEQAPEGLSADFNRINPAAVENLVGFMGDGSPLRSVLDRHGALAANVIREELTNAVIQGRNPKETARQIRKRLYKDGDVPSGQLRSFLNTARTETLRAYREASHQTYQQNADILEGWIWLSALNARTCRACIALHGTFHELGERMKSHVNCRCTQVPAIRGVDLGIEKGTDWFAKQPAAVQKAVLDGEGEFEAYKAGKVRLEDFTGLRRSAKWGDSYQALGLKRALAGEGEFPGATRRERAPETVPPPPPAPPVPQPAPLTPFVEPIPARLRFTAEIEQLLLSRARPYRMPNGPSDPDRVAVETLGLQWKPQPVGLVSFRWKNTLVNIRDIQLGRDNLERARLLQARDLLQGGVLPGKGKIQPIEIAPDPRWVGKYIVLGDGNHRIAALQLGGFEGEIPVRLRPLSRKGRAIQKKFEVFVPYQSPPKDVQLRYLGDARPELRRLLGRDFKDEEIAHAIGALDEARVEVMNVGDGIFFSIHHPLIDTQERTLRREWTGDLYFHNDYFRKARNAPPAVGITSFARQVMGSRLLNVRFIETDAAGDILSPRFIGYYVWPRFGYNAELTEEERARLPRKFAGAKTVADILQKKGGPDWWKAYGSGRVMEFELHEGSQSLQRLAAYIREKNRK